MINYPIHKSGLFLKIYQYLKYPSAGMISFPNHKISRVPRMQHFLPLSKPHTNSPGVMILFPYRLCNSAHFCSHSYKINSKPKQRKTISAHFYKMGLIQDMVVGFKYEKVENPCQILQFADFQNYCRIYLILFRISRKGIL